MPTGVNVYPYNVSPDVAPTYPALPAVTEASVGKSLVLGEDLTLTYESVVTPDSARLLPEVDVVDAGKVLVVDGAGLYELQAPAITSVALADLEDLTEGNVLVPELGVVVSKVGDDVFSPVETLAMCPYEAVSQPYTAVLADGKKILIYATADRYMSLVKWFASTKVLTTNNGSNYWTVELHDDPTEPDAIASFSTNLDSADLWTVHNTVLGANYVINSDSYVYMKLVATGLPGNLQYIQNLKGKNIVFP